MLTVKKFILRIAIKLKPCTVEPLIKLHSGFNLLRCSLGSPKKICAGLHNKENKNYEKKGLKSCFFHFLFFLSTSNIFFLKKYFLSIIIVFIINVFKPYRPHLLKRQHIIFTWKTKNKEIYCHLKKWLRKDNLYKKKF